MSDCQTLNCRSLARLISPMPVPAFLKDYWQHRLLVINRNVPDYFSSVLSIDSIDELISSLKIPSTHVDLSKDSSPIPKSEFCIGDEVDLYQLMNLHRTGATLILRSLHRWSSPLRAIRLSMEECFRCPAQANVYLTPASNKSSPPHFDAHDIFVIQLHGSKRWRIYDKPLPLPLVSERFDPLRHAVGQIREEFTLHAGDVAYLPRGTVHEPDALEYSVHVSVGVIVKTWADLLGEMLRIVSDQQIELREALPMSGCDGAHAPLGTLGHVEKCVELLKDPSIIEKALAKISDDFVSSREISVGGQLRLISSNGSLGISLNTLVRRREGLIYRITKSEGKVHLDFGRVTLSFSEDLESTVNFAAEKEGFCPLQLPGALSEDHKLEFVVRLIHEGFLVVHESVVNLN